VNGFLKFILILLGQKPDGIGYDPIKLDADGNIKVTTGLTQPTTPTDTQPVSEANSAAIKAAVETLDDIVKAEGEAHVSGEKGVLPLAVRNDAGLPLALDGQRTPISTNESGEVLADARQGPAAAIADAWPVKITDGAESLDITPAGAAKVDGSGVTQPISAAALPLAPDASTASAQAAQQDTLNSIRDRADFPLPAAQVSTLTPQTDALTNAQLRAAPVPTAANQGTPNAGGTAAWFMQAEDGKIASIGGIADAEATGNGTLIAILKRIRTLFSGGLPSVLSSDRLKVENQHSQPLTDAQLRATPVPNKGTSTAATGQAAPSDATQVGGTDLSGLLRAIAVDDKGVQYVTPAEARQVALGRFFIGGGKVTVTNNTAVLQIENPAGSGRIIAISQFFLASDAAIDVQFTKNATVDTPTIRTSGNLNLSSAEVAVGVIRTGATGITGGTNFSPIGRLSANITVAYTLPIILPPGTSVAATFAAAGLTATGCYASAAWSEINL
jgi:hypothetical protein